MPIILSAAAALFVSCKKKLYYNHSFYICITICTTVVIHFNAFNNICIQMLNAQCRCRYTSFSYLYNISERADRTDRYGLHSLAIKTSSVSVLKNVL